MAPPPKRYLLDTVALRGFAFAHPEGLSLSMGFLGASRLYFPREVYALDEDTDLPDEDVSEFARGLRYARKQAGPRHRIWLENASQLRRLREEGKIVALALNLPLTKERLRLQDAYGIGRGEAAALALARRIGATAVFLSSDGKAGRVARELEVAPLTLVEVLEMGVRRGLACDALDDLLEGFRRARFGLKSEDASRLQEHCRNGEEGRDG